MTKTLIIVRHGESERNKLMDGAYAIDDKDITNSQPPNHLTPLSEKEKMKQKKFQKF